MKKCAGCGQSLDLAAFTINRARKDGLASKCRSCQAADTKASYAAKREHRQAYANNYRASRLEHTRALERARYAKNRERQIEKSKAWNAANPKRRAEIESTRRARQREAFVEHVDRDIVFERDLGVCQYCGVSVSRDAFHVDHYVALVNGGEHSYENVRLACALCNHRKKDLEPSVFLDRLARPYVKRERSAA